MSKYKLSDKKVDENTLSTLLKPEILNNLTEKNQKIALDTVKEVFSKEKDGGILGKLLGNNKYNLSIHVALILSILLIILGFFIGDKNIWDKILTLLATIIGYIFGANQKEN